MKSPYHPTAAEIEAWAYEADAEEPIQDWDLLLAHERQEALYMKLASARDCPKSEYFLTLLYLIVGDEFRGNFKGRSRDDIERLLRLAEKDFPSYWLHLWVKRSRALLERPETFRYEDWCGGGFAADCESE